MTLSAFPMSTDVIQVAAVRGHPGSSFIDAPTTADRPLEPRGAARHGYVELATPPAWASTVQGREA